MAHYAFLDKNHIVTEVIVGVDENELLDGKTPEIFYGELRNQICKRTSYNGNYRKNFAGIGYIYDLSRDAFIAPKPDNAIGFDEEKCQWIVPDEFANG